MFRQISVFRSALLAGVLPLVCAIPSHAQLSQAVTNAATRLGEQAPSAPVVGTVWLTVRNQAALDAAVKAMYTKGSASYHKFGTVADLAKFAPTAAQAAAVKKQLAAHNLTVLSTDPNNFSIRVTGQTSDFEAALHSPIEQYRTVKGRTLTVLAAKPELGGEAAGMIRAVTGINASVMKPTLAVPVNPATGKQIGIVPFAAMQRPQGLVYSANCLYAPKAVSFTSKGSSLPAALYYGVQYGAPPTNTQYGTLSPCGYSPQDFAQLSGVHTAHVAGYNGEGQTVAIIDAYGSPTIQSDLAAFTQFYKLYPASLTVLKTEPFTTTDAGWAGETTLDVEWVHAVAARAKIVLVTTPSAYNSDLQQALLTIIDKHLANIVSNSYGLGENESSLQDLTTWDELCELASFEGIDVNFATGDHGDMEAAEGLSTPDVSSPADSPFATAIGGTSLAYAPNGGAPFQTGWGTNITALATPSGPDVPPQQLGFYAGSGGGISQVFAKPAYQSKLTGNGRQLPDISAIADPDTGVEILQTLTINGQTGLYFEVIGGTSLSTPVFSGEYALLQQAAGWPLGQAAPLVAEYAGTSYITDVLPPSEQGSTIGTILTKGGFTNYSAAQLIQPETDSPFLGALFNVGGGYYYDLSFGTDSSLPVTAGWDPVTGWGVINMKQAFSSFSK